MTKFATILAFCLVLLIFYYYYSKIKAGKFVIKKTLIGKLAQKCAPAEDTKEYTKTNEKLTKSMSSLDVVDVTAIEIATTLGIFILVVIIFFTNFAFKKEQIYNTPALNTYSATSIYNNASFRKENVNIVKKSIGLKNITDNEYSLKSIKKVLNDSQSISSQNIDHVADITKHDILKINQIYNVPKILIYVLFSLSGFFVAEIVLYLYFRTSERHINEESAKLMNIMSVVLSTTTMPTSSIITMLIDNSRYLKDELQKFFIAYMVNSEEAYNLYLTKAQNKQFRRIISILKQIEDSDQTEAIRNIKNQNENSKTLKRLELENTMEKKDGIALVVMTVGFTFLIKFIVDFCMIAMNSAGAM